MFVALLWFCAKVCASLSTHQSCVKDTSASSLNMHFSLTYQIYRKLHLFNITLFFRIVYQHSMSLLLSHLRIALFFSFFPPI